MPTTTPFVDPGTGTLDIDQVLREARPLARLIGLFVAVALVPLAAAFALLGNSLLGALFTLVAQFVLAVGAGVVGMYVIARGLQLADDSASPSGPVGRRELDEGR